MVNLRTKKWWWPLFQFVVDVTVYNVYQIYRLSHLNKNLISNHLEFLNSIMDDFSKSYSNDIFLGDFNTWIKDNAITFFIFLNDPTSSIDQPTFDTYESP